MPTPPTHDRLLAIGDIHGCLDKLRSLLAQVHPSEGDQVVFLGDYIDRGPDSRGVLDELIGFQTRFPQTVFLRGNHEQMLDRFLKGEDLLTYLLNGGLQTLAGYRRSEDDDRPRLPKAHRRFLANLQRWYATEEYIFVHAGLRPGIPLEQQTEDDLLWIRREFLQSDYSWGKTVVFGHTPLQEPLQEPERLGLDTGAVYGRQLTCCEVHSRTFWFA